MCEILTIIKTDNKPITEKQLERFLYRSLTASNHNKDGWGIMSEQFTMRSPAPFTKKDIQHILKTYKKYGSASRFFTVHVRFATCEIKEEYTHPFTFDNFIGVHNGCVTVNDIKTGSDSLNFFTELDKHTKNDNTLFESIKKTVANTSGSYSVLLYAQNEKKLYYFRNTPSFDFMYVKKENIVYGATDIDRLHCLDYKLLGFFESALESRPLQDTVYCIDLNNGRFNRAGYIEEKQITYTYSGFKNTTLNTAPYNETIKDDTESFKPIHKRAWNKAYDPRENDYSGYY